MKNILYIFFVTLQIISTAYAVDISIDTDSTRSISREKTMGNTKTITNDNTYKTTLNLSLLLTDKINKPCTQTPQALRDFGLSYISRNGNINLTKKEFLENAGQNSMKLKEVGIDDELIKKYLECLLEAGAIIAQASINFPKLAKENLTEIELEKILNTAIDSGEVLEDFKIKSLLTKAKKQLEEDCRFFNSIETIICGNIVLEMSSQKMNQVTYLNHHLFGESNSSYGISTNLDVTIATASSDETTIKKSSTATEQSSDKQSISLGKFIPQ